MTEVRRCGGSVGRKAEQGRNAQWLTSRVVRGNLCAHKARGLFGILSCCMQAFELVHGLGTQDSLAEWSKALAQGASPQGRGFKPHSCHCSNGERERRGRREGREERGEERGMRERRERGKGEKREKREGCPLSCRPLEHAIVVAVVFWCFVSPLAFVRAAAAGCRFSSQPAHKAGQAQKAPTNSASTVLRLEKNAHNAAEWTGPCHRKSSWQGSGQDKPAEKKDQWTCLTRAGVRDSAPHTIIKSCSPRGWQEKAKPPPVARPAA